MAAVISLLSVFGGGVLAGMALVIYAQGEKPVAGTVIFATLATAIGVLGVLNA